MHVFSSVTNRTDGDLRGKKRDEVTLGEGGDLKILPCPFRPEILILYLFVVFPDSKHIDDFLEDVAKSTFLSEKKKLKWLAVIPHCHQPYEVLGS